MKLSKRYLLSTLLVILSALFLVSTASAFVVVESERQVTLNVHCTPDGQNKNQVDMAVYGNLGDDHFHFQLIDNNGVIKREAHHKVDWTNTAKINHPQFAPPYTMKVWYGQRDASGTPDIVVTDGCKGVAGEPVVHTYWVFSVADQGDTSAYVYDGVEACGVFDVLSFGIKTVDLLDYPNCEGHVMVMCLDGEGNWTDTNVVDFTQVGTVVQWTSTQHGTCAFFEE